MAGMDFSRRHFFELKTDRFSKRGMFKTTETFAALFFVIAITNQWLIGYYAADYYSHKPKQQGLNVEALKTLTLNLRDKNIKGIKFSDFENLIKFECNK